ncbi:hypothetical protein PHYPO_G00193720 [Pangasianodon hypophthalmus]|uniref:Uncharacterized protein n=2 Tax=Pangasianodon hypophthalmus TaxID=310915 RepID=A0A5N5PHZ5_PANHP|nr:hypothetical protein PHYPO_G00193720 [Pangasianodon hypophthalmus]
MAAAADAWHPLNVVPSINFPWLVRSKSLLVALPIAQIAIGAKYLKECTQQNYIPVYVLVCGVFSMSLLLLTCLPCFQKDNPALKCLCYIWNSLVSGFTLCWFIAGSVWIYSIYPPNYNSTVVGEPYCNKILYQFALWTTTLVYILLAILLVGCCCLLICVCICKPKAQSEVVTQA